MSEQLLEFLQVSPASHGVKSDRSGNAVRAQDGLLLEPRVFIRDSVGGTAQVQVDFAIESPRLPGIAFLDSFAGVGDTLESADKECLLEIPAGFFSRDRGSADHPLL